MNESKENKHLFNNSIFYKHFIGVHFHITFHLHVLHFGIQQILPVLSDEIQ